MTIKLNCYYSRFLAALVLLTSAMNECCTTAFVPAAAAPHHHAVGVATRTAPASSSRTPFFSPTATATATAGHPSKLTARNLAMSPPAAAAKGLARSLFNYGGNVPFVQALGLNVVLFTVFQNKLKTMLTPTGFYHAMALGTVLWTTLGWRGWTLCVTYLLFGQLVTKVKFADKEKRGLAEGRGGRRGPENVWGSAATGMACAICSVQGASFLGIGSDLYLLAFVASLSTKLADTFASEIGKAYGKTTFLITTFQRVDPGTEGAVSAEGTAAAVVGGLLLSLYGRAVGLIDTPAIAVSTVAAFLATNVESLIGATLQEREGFGWMTNEVVNFINTLVGAGIAIGMGKALLGMS